MSVTKISHRGNKRGRAVYVQVIKDKDGKVVKTIRHFVDCTIKNNLMKRGKSRLRKSMSNQPRNTKV